MNGGHSFSEDLRKAQEEHDFLLVAQHNAMGASFWVVNRLYQRARTCLMSLLEVQRSRDLKRRMYRV